VKAANEPAFGATAERLEASLADLDEAASVLTRQLSENRNAALAGATPFARLFGLATGGVFLAKGALSAARNEGSAEAQIIEARHFAESLMGETAGLKQAALHGHETISRADAVLGGR
jgi:acyl-CoA dehydrogenase